MRALPSSLKAGFTQFYDHDEPGLPAGTYDIVVTQSLPNTATDQFSTTTTRRFVSQGPQFALETSEIHAVFPAANSNGDFREVLPNILLENPKLPWERLITSDPAVPWMALLVFRRDEITVDPLTASPLITSSVADFLAAAPGTVKPAIDPHALSAPVLASSMNSIRIGTDVFSAVAPRLVELASLAHVREVDPQHQAVDELGANPWYSVLMANRFAGSASSGGTGVEYFVHLVSLEGLTAYLVDQPAWPAGAEAVQLASLANWRFVSTAQPGQTFGDLAANLVESAGGDPSQWLLKIPAAADGSAAAARLAQGYTALSFHTLPGEDTFAWYRGPFSAVPPQPLPGTIGTWLRPAQAKIYDEAHGIFDQSYAAAWTIGRLAALADPEFVDSLQQVRARVRRLARRLLERSKMPHLAGLGLDALAEPGATRRHLGRAFAAGIGERLTAILRAGPADGAGHPPPAEARRNRRSENHLLPGETPPAHPAAQMRWFLGHEEVSSFLTAQVADDLDPMGQWLAKLVLLYNIPFNHLVPDQRMLPVESVRFFYVDQGWLTVLANAAMTVGIHGTRDRHFNGLIAPELWRRAQGKVGQVRRALLRKPQAGTTPLPTLPASGMLLRSELVSGWPGLQVAGTRAGAPLEALRIDRVAPNVLLVLWPDVPDTVSLGQPQQGLAYGVENRQVALRSLAAATLGQQTGAFYPTGGAINQFFRPTAGTVGGEVLQLVPASAGAANYLVPGLGQALGQATPLSPAQFAIEMVNSPQQIVFNPPTSEGRRK